MEVRYIWKQQSFFTCTKYILIRILAPRQIEPWKISSLRAPVTGQWWRGPCKFLICLFFSGQDNIALLKGRSSCWTPTVGNPESNQAKLAGSRLQPKCALGSFLSLCRYHREGRIPRTCGLISLATTLIARIPQLLSVFLPPDYHSSVFELYPTGRLSTQRLSWLSSRLRAPSLRQAPPCLFFFISPVLPLPSSPLKNI